MSQTIGKKPAFLFSSKNRLDQCVFLHILEFLNRHELINLSTLKYYSGSEEIENHFYNQQLLDQMEFGTCLIIYSWNDWFWREWVSGKVIRINKIIQSITSTRIEMPTADYRAGFMKEIWNKVNWKRIDQQRNERKLY